MSWLLGAIGLGAAGSAASTAASFAMQKRAQEFQKSMYQHRYQYQMNDMRKAGLNPILSYRTGAPGSGGSPMGSIPDMGQSMTAGLARGAEASKAGNARSLMNAQRGAADASAVAAGAAAEHSAASAAKARTETAIMGAELQRAKILQDWYGSDWGRRSIIGRDVLGAAAPLLGGSALGFLAGKGMRRRPEPGVSSARKTNIWQWMKRQRQRNQSAYDRKQNQQRFQNQKDKIPDSPPWDRFYPRRGNN